MVHCFRRTHAHPPCLPLNVGQPSDIIELRQIIYRLLLNSIIIQSFLEVTSAALELQNSAYRLFFFCMQKLQWSRAEATVI